MSGGLIELAWWELGIGAALVVALAVVTHFGRLGLTRDLLVAAARMMIQLAIIGLVLETLFSVGAFHWVALMAIVMLLLAGREVMARQKRRLTRLVGLRRRHPVDVRLVVRRHRASRSSW
jgi:putative ABC transport system permease protein